jgi:uncharacterized protein (DUF2235 family)
MSNPIVLFARTALAAIAGTSSFASTALQISSDHMLSYFFIIFRRPALKGLQNTNVIELYSQLVKDNNRQVTYYDSGIGTYAQPSWKSWNYWKQVVDNSIDLMIAW